MTSFTVVAKDANATQVLGHAIGRLLSGGEVILLSGPLGAGKTTMTQGIAAGLGVSGLVQSPSFVLERVHRGRLGLRHLDFYRLGPADIEDAGFFEEPDGSQVTVVEWAEKAAGMPDATLVVTILPVTGEPERRSIRIDTPCGEWSDKIHHAIRQAGF